MQFHRLTNIENHTMSLNKTVHGRLMIDCHVRLPVAAETDCTLKSQKSLPLSDSETDNHCVSLSGDSDSCHPPTVPDCVWVHVTRSLTMSPSVTVPGARIPWWQISNHFKVCQWILKRLHHVKIIAYQAYKYHWQNPGIIKKFCFNKKSSFPAEVSGVQFLFLFDFITYFFVLGSSSYQSEFIPCNQDKILSVTA